MLKKNKQNLIIISILSIFCIFANCTSQSENTSSEQKLMDYMTAGLQQNVQIDPPTYTFGEMTMDQAYSTQKVIAGKMSEMNGVVCGYKVAYASKAAQAQFGIDEPARGPLYLIQRTANGSVLSQEMFNEIMLETEIGFIIGKRIDQPVENIESLKKYVKSIHAAFDAGNFPYKTDKQKPTPQDMVAIGTGSHVFVLGPAVDPQSLILKDLDLKLIRNQETIRQSPASEVLGDPWNSLLWIANHLVNDGLTLEPGMVVVSGTAAPAYKVKGEEIKGEYEGDCGALGKVTMMIK
jgi:2-keto-4-pentenoate hydratase